MELNGTVLGVPYDFRRPTWSKIKSNYWNPDDERIFMPRAFGIGWDINLYRFRERYPALFYAAVTLTILREVVRLAAFIRRHHKKSCGEE